MMNIEIGYTFRVALVGGRTRNVTMYAVSAAVAQCKAEEKLAAAGFRWTIIMLQPPALRAALTPKGPPTE